MNNYDREFVAEQWVIHYRSSVMNIVARRLGLGDVEWLAPHELMARIAQRSSSVDGALRKFVSSHETWAAATRNQKSQDEIDVLWKERERLRDSLMTAVNGAERAS